MFSELMGSCVAEAETSKWHLEAVDQPGVPAL